MQPQTDAAPTVPPTELPTAAERPNTVVAALERLEGIDALPLEQRAEAFHEIHENLRAALAEIDDA